MNKLILPISWMIALGTVILISTQVKSAANHFFGIADNKEQTVSFSYPVKIENVEVVEGERVSQQQIVLQVSKRELATKKAIIEEQINETLSKYREEISSTTAQLKSLEAKKAATLAELNGKIERLQSTEQLNQKVLSEISGIGSNSGSTHAKHQGSPLLAEIAALKKQRNHLGRSMQAQIDNLKGQLAQTGNRPIDAQLSELREIKAQLEQQEIDLIVKTSLNGRVGSIMYKANEQVAPFDTILTIHSETPGFVKGYIHEDVLNHIKVGQVVWIKPMSSNTSAGIYKGFVQSLGNRIVEYPQRLLKNPQVQAWGREVIVGLPAENKFLSGEKVEVFLNQPQYPAQVVKLWFSNAWTLIAGNFGKNLPNKNYASISLPLAIRNKL